MPLLKDGKICPDYWYKLADDEPLAPLGNKPVLLPFKRLEADAATLKARHAPFGVLLKPGEKMDDGDDVRALAPWLSQLKLIAVEFPKFRNGRGYSIARILREEMGWTEELRACGEVLRDQWQFMHRCGFDAYDIPSDSDTKHNASGGSPDDHANLEKAFADAIGELSLTYQPDSLATTSILHKRHQKG